MRMFRSEVVGVLVAALTLASHAGAQQQAPNRWAVPKCDIKPAHFLVNSGLLYLKSATETKFEDQRQKDLRDARGVLTQALTTGSQDKNPAAWYYLGDALNHVDDLTGALAALERAVELQPTNPKALYGIGKVLDRLNRPDEATVMYRRSREVAGR